MSDAAALAAFLAERRASILGRFRRELRGRALVFSEEALGSSEEDELYDEVARLVRDRGEQAPRVFAQLAGERGLKRLQAGVRLRDALRELGTLHEAILVEWAGRPDALGPGALVLLGALFDEGLAGVAGKQAGVRSLGEPTAHDALTRALDQLAEGVVLLDEDGSLLRANRAADELLGVALSRGTEDRSGVVAAALAALRTGQPVGPERRELRDPRSGEERTLELHAAPLPETGGAVQILRDLTTDLRRERALERADRELAALHERVLRVSHDRSLSDVAAGSALQLNNELNALQLAARLLRIELAAPLSDTAARHLEQLDAAARRAAEAVARLQELATRRQKEPRPIDLDDALMDALDLVRPELTAAGTDRAVRLDARLGTVGQVRAPGLELRDVLCKLLVVARDRLPRGGVMQLWTRRAGALGELEIVQSPPSEPLDEAARLGLDVARATVERWGGALEELEDASVHRLRLRLPLAAEARPTPPPAPAPAPKERSRRVLVVDDDAGNRETLAELLSLLGYEVSEAESSAQALALAERQPFQAALLDLAMPGMNGLELARRLRALRPEARLALVTGWEPETDAASSELVEAVFRKPIDLPAIQAFLDEQPQAA